MLISAYGAHIAIPQLNPITVMRAVATATVEAKKVRNMQNAKRRCESCQTRERDREKMVILGANWSCSEMFVLVLMLEFVFVLFCCRPRFTKRGRERFVASAASAKQKQARIPECRATSINFLSLLPISEGSR